MKTELIALLHLSDPTLPIGGFNHSGGLETFVQDKTVNSADTLKQYVKHQLQQNWTHNDGAYVSLAYDATMQGDVQTLMALDDKIGATKTPKEIRDASAKLGVRLLKIFCRYETHPLVGEFQNKLTQKVVQGFYPLVFGLIGAGMKQSKDDVLTAFYYNATVGAVTNGVKLIPLSQTDGQDIMFELRDDINTAVTHSLSPDKAWLGASSMASDIRAMQHERLYTRLYMS